MKDKLLFIGVPTYNRAAYLDKCLGSLLPQVKEYEDLIDFYVSDNASTDNTTEIVHKYISEGFKINYRRNDSNLGADGNFEALYKMADAKYIWLFSDDDMLFSNILNRIISVLRGEDVGVLYLSNVWYKTRIDNISSGFNDETRITRYDDPLKFVSRIHYWLTFISSIITNKSVVERKVDVDYFKGTHLIALGWIIPAVFQNIPNCVLENHAVACKDENSGGYGLCKVFGTHFNEIMDTMIARGIDDRIKPIINTNLLATFFPHYMRRRLDKFSNEHYFTALFPIFWRYKLFWQNIAWFFIKDHFKMLTSKE